MKKSFFLLVLYSLRFKCKALKFLVKCSPLMTNLGLNKSEMFISFRKKPFVHKNLSAENLISSSLSSRTAIYRSDFSSSRVALHLITKRFFAVKLL